MSYKVLNLEGDKIIVDEINPQIHRHLSGRNFTENDTCVKKVVKTKTYKMGDTKKTFEEVAPNMVKLYDEGIKRVDATEGEFATKEGEYNMEEAREEYKKKHGRYPSRMMKLENIVKKL